MPLAVRVNRRWRSLDSQLRSQLSPTDTRLFAELFGRSQIPVLAAEFLVHDAAARADTRGAVLMTRKSSQRASKETPRRLSRSTLKKLLQDLCGRLDKQVEIAEAIMKVAKPTGETLVGALPMLRVIELVAAVHLSELQRARDLARVISNACSGRERSIGIGCPKPCELP